MSIYYGDFVKKIFLINSAFFLLGYAQYDFISVIFGYQGYSWNPSFFRIIVALLMLNLINLFLPLYLRKPSDFLVNYHFIFPILPLLVLYAFQGYDVIFILASSFCFLWVLFLTKIAPISISIFSLKKEQYINLLLLVAFIVLISIFLMGGYRYFNLDITKVYFFREDASNNLPSIFGYILPALGKVVLPMALALCLKLKFYYRALIVALACLILFGLTGTRSMLFYPVVVFTVYFLFNYFRSLNFLFFFYAAIVGFLVLLASLTPIGETVSSLIIRRAFIFPAYITTLYFDFFSVNEKVFWSLSQVTFGFLDYPYYLKPGNLISHIYFDEVSMNVNTGWLGSGYMQLGFVGMFIYSSLLGLIIYIINCFSIEKDARLIGASLVGIFMSIFQSIDLLTSLFTHGLLLILLIIAILPKDNLKKS